jgi:hypothetical protein
LHDHGRARLLYNRSTYERLQRWTCHAQLRLPSGTSTDTSPDSTLQHQFWQRAATGATEPLFDAQKMRAAFDALPGLREEDIKTLPNARSLEMNAAHNAALISIGNDLNHYTFGADRAFRLTFDPDAEEEFSLQA